jgi:predicted transposase/invertase (TIGR01784 family)
LEMPHFDKQEHELVTRLDKWLYFIKHLEDFQYIPEIFRDEVFTQAFSKAEIAKYSSDERDEYEQSLKIYRDMKGVIDTAFDEGKLEGLIEGETKGEMKGIAKGKIEIAKFMKAEGEPLEKIMRYTGLSKEEINNL